jgi:hypothetical protein
LRKQTHTRVDNAHMHRGAIRFARQTKAYGKLGRPAVIPTISFSTGVRLKGWKKIGAEKCWPSGAEPAGRAPGSAAGPHLLGPTCWGGAFGGQGPSSSATVGAVSVSCGDSLEGIKHATAATAFDRADLRADRYLPVKKVGPVRERSESLPSSTRKSRPVPKCCGRVCSWCLL